MLSIDYEFTFTVSSEASIVTICPGESLQFELDAISTHDVRAALSSTKPSARTLVDKYAAWRREYESV